MSSVVNRTMRRPSGVSTPSTATRGPSSVGGYCFANGSSSAGSEIISPPAFRNRFSRPWKTIAPVGVELRQVAGDVPRLPSISSERRRAVVAEVAGEHGRPARRAACPSCPRGSTSSVSRSVTHTSTPGSGWPMVPGFDCARPVDRHDRRALGDAVALQHLRVRGELLRLLEERAAGTSPPRRRSSRSESRSPGFGAVEDVARRTSACRR